MNTKETLFSWLKGQDDMVAVLVHAPELGDTRWGVMRAANLDLYRELFPEHEILEIVRPTDAIGSA